MAYPPRKEIEEHLKELTDLAVNLLIGGLLPMVGILISAQQLEVYAIPLAIAITLYIFETCRIFTIKETSPWWRYSKRREKSEKALKYFIILLSVIAITLALKYIAGSPSTIEYAATAVITAIIFLSYFTIFHKTTIKILIQYTKHTVQIKVKRTIKIY